MPPAIAEVIVSNYNGKTCRLRADLFETMPRGLALRLGPADPTLYALEWDAFQRVKRGTWSDAAPRALGPLPLSPPPCPRLEGATAEDLGLETIGRVQLQVERNASVLRRLHWESHHALQDRNVFRFQAAESIARPASLPRPRRILFASTTNTIPPTVPNAPIGLTTCPIDNLHQHLQTSLQTPPGEPISFRDSVVVLAAHAALVGHELVIDAHQQPHFKEIPLAPLLASLRDDQGEYPQMIVLFLYEKHSTDFDHQGTFSGWPLALAHDLVAAGVPLVAVLHNVRDARDEIVAHLALAQTRTCSGAVSTVDWLWQTLLASTAPSEPLFPQKPVLVTRFRSGNLWAAIEPADAVVRSYRDAQLHTVVVGPQLMVSADPSQAGPSRPWRQPWLRAPIDILNELLRLPIYPEDLRSGYQLGSYIETVLDDRRGVEKLYYLSWIYALRSHLAPDWDEIVRCVIHDSTSRASYSHLVHDTISVLSRDNYLSRIKASVRQVLGIPEVNLESEQPLDNLERRLAHLLDLYRPTMRDSGDEMRFDTARALLARRLLENTPWWRLAQLKADLYVTVEPMPFLEYALALQPDVQDHPVEYTIFPWYMQTDSFFRSRACPDPAEGSAAKADAATPGSRPRRLVYLCGSVVDPPILLLSEEDVVERLIGGRLSWPYLLSEIGDCLGRQGCTLFLGFSPDDALFRQILRTMFLDRQSSPRSRLIVAPRPDSSFYTYPKEGAEFLEGQLQYHIPAIQQRAEIAATTPSISTNPALAGPRPRESINLYWGDPMDIVLALLPAEPPPATTTATPPPTAPATSPPA